MTGRYSAFLDEIFLFSSDRYFLKIEIVFLGNNLLNILQKKEGRKTLPVIDSALLLRQETSDLHFNCLQRRLCGCALTIRPNLCQTNFTCEIIFTFVLLSD